MDNGQFWKVDSGQLTVIGVTGVVSLNQKKPKSDVFGLRWLKNTPTSETVGNGLCAVPGTSLDITLADEWYCPIHGTPNVAAMIHRQATWQL